MDRIDVHHHILPEAYVNGIELSHWMKREFKLTVHNSLDENLRHPQRYEDARVEPSTQPGFYEA
jgi:hypothetical protein